MSAQQSPLTTAEDSSQANRPAAAEVEPDATTGGGSPVSPLVALEEVRKFSGHSDAVMCVAFSPDGLHLVSGSEDTSVRLWNASTREEVRRFDGHTGRVDCAVFQGDGTLFMTADTGDQIKFWNPQNNYPDLTFETSSLRRAVISSSGRLLVVSGGSDVRVLNGQTGKELRRLTGHHKDVWGLAVSPDNRFALTGDNAGVVRLWHIDTGEEVRRFDGYTSVVRVVTFSPDGRTVLAGGADSKIRLWDRETGREIRLFRGHNRDVFDLAFTPNGRFIVSGGRDGTVRVWDVATGHQIAQNDAHSSIVWSIAMSPDGRHAASASRDKTIRLWNLGENAAIDDSLVNAKKSISLPAMNKSGNATATADVEAKGSTEPGSPSGTIITLDEIRKFNGHFADVMCVTFSPDGRHLLTGSDDQSARLWEVGTGEQIRRFDARAGRIDCAGFNADATSFMTEHGDGQIKLWNPKNTEPEDTFDVAPLRKALISPDGRLIFVSGGPDVRVLDSQSGQELRRLAGHHQDVWGLALSPDVNFVLTGDNGGTVRLWRIDSGEEVRRFEGHTAAVRVVTFSPEGGTILTGGADSTIRLWDRQTGKEVRQFAGHRGEVYDVAFTPTGRFIVSGGGDRSVRVWEVETGDEIVNSTAHGAIVWKVAVSPDGRYAASASRDKTVRLWKLGEHAAIDESQLAARRISRSPELAGSDEAKPTRIAVLEFVDKGPSVELAPLRVALAEMLTGDLSRYRALEAVERSRVGQFLKETSLGTSGLVDPATAQRAGRAMATEYLLSGSFSGKNGSITL